MRMLRSNLLSGGLATALVMLLTLPASAQQGATDLGTFRNWNAWKATDQYGALCYISSSPQSTSPTQINGAPINRDPPFFLVIHRALAPVVNTDRTFALDAAGKQILQPKRNEVQTVVGYPMRPTTDTVFHEAQVDGRVYPMRSIPDDPSTANVNDSEGAWLASVEDEGAFVEALKKGSTLVVKGTSARGNAITDTYSLAGVTAAMDAIDKACP